MSDTDETAGQLVPFDDDAARRGRRMRTSQHIVTAGVALEIMRDDKGQPEVAHIIVHLADDTQRELALEVDDMDALARKWLTLRWLRDEVSEVSETDEAK